MATQYPLGLGRKEYIEVEEFMMLIGQGFKIFSKLILESSSIIAERQSKVSLVCSRKSRKICHEFPQNL